VGSRFQLNTGMYLNYLRYVCTLLSVLVIIKAEVDIEREISPGYIF
jgi:hypothetical protein